MATKKSSSDLLQIAVTFPRPQDGLGPIRFGLGVTADMVSSFIPDKDTINRALAEFQRHGFVVTTLGRLTASIRGKQADFEKLFGTKLSMVPLASDVTTHYSASSVLFPSDKAPWKPNPPG